MTLKKFSKITSPSRNIILGDKSIGCDTVSSFTIKTRVKSLEYSFYVNDGLLGNISNNNQVTINTGITFGANVVQFVFFSSYPSSRQRLQQVTGSRSPACTAA